MELSRSEYPALLVSNTTTHLSKVHVLISLILPDQTSLQPQAAVNALNDRLRFIHKTNNDIADFLQVC